MKEHKALYSEHKEKTPKEGVLSKRLKKALKAPDRSEETTALEYTLLDIAANMAFDFETYVNKAINNKGKDPEGRLNFAAKTAFKLQFELFKRLSLAFPSYRLPDGTPVPAIAAEGFASIIAELARIDQLEEAERLGIKNREILAFDHLRKAGFPADEGLGLDLVNIMIEEKILFEGGAR